MQSTEASAARKGARRDSDRKTMSGLKALVERPVRVRRHRQIAGTPTRLSNTKRLADKAPVAGVTTQGMVTASRGEAPLPTEGASKWVIRSQVRSRAPAHPIREAKDAVHRLHGGGFPACAT